MGTHSCLLGPMQMTDSELHLGLFADAREKKGRGGENSPAPETIHSLSLLLWDSGVHLFRKVGHSVQACWAFTRIIHINLQFSAQQIVTFTVSGII